MALSPIVVVPSAVLFPAQRAGRNHQPSQHHGDATRLGYCDDLQVKTVIHGATAELLNPECIASGAERSLKPDGTIARNAHCRQQIAANVRAAVMYPPQQARCRWRV